MGIFEDKLRRDLALRGKSDNTIETCARCCRRFCKQYKRAPIELSAADVRTYLEHLRVTERRRRARSTCTRQRFGSCTP
ncbi:MAG: phage integrase N-terminal SAM-like domain-containing protein [Polyangiales bacterium]